MNTFTLHRSQEIDEALTFLATHAEAKPIGGGTNLLDHMKLDLVRPPQLLDINALPLQDAVALESGGLRIGALMTNTDLAYHPLVEARYPLLAEAILAGASPQLRNMATVGGNLMQRTRCYYFYDKATACNKREPGQGCAARDGYNRMHAILGTSPSCIAVHPSDMCVALAALEARVHLRRLENSRVLDFADFHRLPEDHPEQDNHLQPGELITAIELPQEGYPDHYAYLKIRDRSSYAFALVSVAAGLKIEDGLIRKARLALGGVAHKPWRKRAAEEVLEGQPVDKADFQGAAHILLEGAQSFGHNEFKIQLAGRAIVRALQDATGRTS